MIHYILFPADVNGDISHIKCMLPGSSHTILLPGDVISVSSVRLPVKFLSKKKMRRFIIDNLSDDVPFDWQNEEVVFLSSAGEEQGFFIVKRSLWMHWLQLRETLSPELKNAKLLPDWMLLPVPRTVQDGLSIQLGERILYRRTQWLGASIPTMMAHCTGLPEMMTLRGTPSRNLQRFERDRFFHVIRQKNALKKIVEKVNSPAIIFWLLIFLLFQNGIITTEGYILWKKTSQNTISESHFLPAWLNLQKFSDTTPFYLQSVNSSAVAFSVSMNSRENCQQLTTQAHHFFPQGKIHSMKRGNNNCFMTITLPEEMAK